MATEENNHQEEGAVNSNAVRLHSISREGRKGEEETYIALGLDVYQDIQLMDLLHIAHDEIGQGLAHFLMLLTESLNVIPMTVRKRGGAEGREQREESSPFIDFWTPAQRSSMSARLFW